MPIFKAMKITFIAIFLFAGVQAFAQRQNVYFINKDGAYITNRDSAEFIRIVREPDSASTLYNVFELYPSGTRKLIGKSSRIDPPDLQGQCMTFYPDGKKKEISYYKNNVPVGSQYTYFPNGKLYTELKYDELTPYEYAESVDRFTYVDEFDSLGTVLMKDGDGIHREYDEKYKKVLGEGAVKDGKPDGQWKGSDLGMHLRYEEIYEKGQLVSGISISDKEDTVRYSNARMVAPRYKGGAKAFANYLGNNIVYPDYEKQNNIQGKVLLSFVVDRNGKVTEIKILHSVDAGIDDEAVRVLKQSNAWLPATSYGRFVRVRYTIPISFTLN